MPIPFDVSKYPIKFGWNGWVGYVAQGLLIVIATILARDHILGSALCNILAGFCWLRSMRSAWQEGAIMGSNIALDEIARSGFVIVKPEDVKS